MRPILADVGVVAGGAMVELIGEVLAGVGVDSSAPVVVVGCVGFSARSTSSSRAGSWVVGAGVMWVGVPLAGVAPVALAVVVAPVVVLQ